jgi:hypothetical protein
MGKSCGCPDCGYHKETLDCPNAEHVERLERNRARLIAITARLLVLATKWCPKDHQDWEVVMQTADRDKQ